MFLPQVTISLWGLNYGDAYVRLKRLTTGLISLGVRRSCGEAVPLVSRSTSGPRTLIRRFGYRMRFLQSGTRSVSEVSTGLASQLLSSRSVPKSTLLSGDGDQPSTQRGRLSTGHSLRTASAWIAMSLLPVLNAYYYDGFE